MKNTILPTKTVPNTDKTSPFGHATVRAQRDRAFHGDNGKATDTVKGAKKTPMIPASRTVKGQPVIKYGKKVKLV